MKLVGSYEFMDLGPGVHYLEASGQRYILDEPDTLYSFFSERSDGDILELTGETVEDTAVIGGSLLPVFRVATATVVPLE